MGNEDGRRTPEGSAQEHDRIQREIENRPRPIEGGLTSADLGRLAREATREDVERIRGEQGIETWLRPDPEPAESILDEIDDADATTGVAGLAPDDAPVLTGAMRDALRQPETAIRLVAAGLGVIGLLVLAAALLSELRAEVNQVPGGTLGSPPASATVTTASSAAPSGSPTETPGPTATSSPISQLPSPVTGTVTANASFTKVSGPCAFAQEFVDSYELAAIDGALTLTQLSNGHVSRGTIEPNGDFATAGDGQGYRGHVSGSTAEGQHTYTADGCDEVYDFTMQLSGPLLPTATPTSSPTSSPGATGTQAPPSAAPTASPAAASGTPAPGGGTVTGTTRGPNIPLAIFGAGLAIFALGLFLRGPILIGGPIATGQPPKDPCDREKAAEAAARERLARARARFDRISSLSEASRAAQAEADAKARAADEAKRGASYAESGGVRHYTNRKKAAEIGAAEAAAATAREAAARANAAYADAGGQDESMAAQDELYRANRDWEQANESLQRCLQLFAPPPSPPPTTGGEGTGGGTGPSGPAIATGPSTQTRERTCTQGEVKPGSEQARSREITVNELNRVQIILDATYPYARSVPLTEFVEFMDGFRRAFKAGKAISTVIDGTVVEGALDTIDATGIADVPDFLTYWDKLTEATLKGLKETGDIFIDRFGKLGDYQLEFTRRIHTATCRTWEECDDGRWVPRQDVTIEITRTERNRRTRTITVHDKSEIADAIDRLFNDLARENERGTRDLKAFEESCGR